ncbi:PREDICTED: peptidyl-prolyl cis-trans isomerase FKBP8 isoform X2 [Vollenhovia emeryi]|nr:PREDICTED: peptidyl-prolyl cis-trans isomerase FKBP8 isoform X2 [Vollenhovia emeryi]
MNKSLTLKKDTPNDVPGETSDCDDSNHSTEVSEDRPEEFKMERNVTPGRKTPDDVSCETFDSDDSNHSTEVSEDKPEEEDWMDILGQGHLKKRVIRKGEKGMRPEKGDICTINFVGKLCDGTEVEKEDHLSIQVGDLEVIQGLDLAIVLMELGEIAEIVINERFAYGMSGTSTIPSLATVTYVVELKAIEVEPDIESLSISQRRERGNKKRERGNWWFGRHSVSYAVQCYRRALQYLQIDNGKTWNENEGAEPVTDAELQALLNDCIKVYNNLAAALIEMEVYAAALENADLVLKYQPNNIKALFRKGKILKLKGEYGKAYMVLLEAQKVEPESKWIHMELMSLKGKITKQYEKERLFYAKMLGIGNNGVSKDVKDVKECKVRNKSNIAKGILWTLVGASAAIVGIFVHRFAS